MLPVPNDPKIFNALVNKHFKQEAWEQELTTNSGDLKAIADYSGVDLANVLDLPYAQFKAYQHDSWIANMRRSDEGRKFLETCWRLKQTTADEKAVKKFQQYGGGN
ncbi:hypothetical protein [Enterococcus casseliflavus]|uniref:Uncharacterized protein n=1 Tax=Enterococcus casseliflavus TaxID=37734 RepID=A0ABD5FQZ2_ENTCA|nr:hypothetical protein [Enterococcus casseliflavus]MDT2984486.1 hypothetical protein [Enterococcus casseliflavus]